MLSITYIVTALVVLLLLSILIEPLADLLKLPFSLLLLLLGFAVTELVIAFGLDTGLRAENYRELVFHVLLPPLIFEAAWRLNLRLLRANLLAIGLLSVAGMLISTVIVAVILFAAINHPGFSLLAALITGALLAATDPVAVVAQMRRFKAPKRLEVLLEGESLFNDATTVVMFSVLVALVAVPESFSLMGSILTFFTVFVGGLVFGLLFGLAALVFLRWYKWSNISLNALGVALAYGAFLLAEHWHFSGIMATLSVAVVFRLGVDKYLPKMLNEHGRLWDNLGYVANNIIFILSGAIFSLNMFSERWSAILFGIVAVLVARFVSVGSCLWVANRVNSDPYPLAYQTVLVWGGLRGAVTLALVLSLPATLPGWWTVQSIAFGVVLFTLVVQAPTMPYVLKHQLNKITA